MKVALLSSEESQPDFLEMLKAKMETKIADLEFSIIKARKNLDIPKKLSKIEGFDIVVVVILYSSESMELKTVLEKLIDIDIEGIEIIKMLEKTEPVEDMSEKEAMQLKNELTAKAEEILTGEILK